MRCEATKCGTSEVVTDSCASIDTPQISSEPFGERHYTVEEIAAMWHLSKDAVRKLFRNEPGVFVYSNPNPRIRKRPYTTLRIPQSVLERVHQQYSLSQQSLKR